MELSATKELIMIHFCAQNRFFLNSDSIYLNIMNLKNQHIFISMNNSNGMLYKAYIHVTQVKMTFCTKEL